VEGFVQCPHFPDREEGALQMWKSTLFGAKKLRILQIYGVSAVRTVKRGLSQYGHFADRGEGQFLTTLCGRISWTAPNVYSVGKLIIS